MATTKPNSEEPKLNGEPREPGEPKPAAGMPVAISQPVASLVGMVEQTPAHAVLSRCRTAKAAIEEALAAGEPVLDDEESSALAEALGTITDIHDRLDDERKRWGA